MIVGVGLVVIGGVILWKMHEKSDNNFQANYNDILTTVDKRKIRNNIERHFESFRDDQEKWYRIMVLSVKYSFDAEQESYDKKIESVSGFKDINEDWAPEEIQAAQDIFVEIIKENTGVDTRSYSENKMIRFYRRYMELKAKKNALESIENTIDVKNMSKYENDLDTIRQKIENL